MVQQFGKLFQFGERIKALDVRPEEVSPLPPPRSSSGGLCAEAGPRGASMAGGHGDGPSSLRHHCSSPAGALCSAEIARCQHVELRLIDEVARCKRLEIGNALPAQP